MQLKKQNEMNQISPYLLLMLFSQTFKLTQLPKTLGFVLPALESLHWPFSPGDQLRPHLSSQSSSVTSTSHALHPTLHFLLSSLLPPIYL